MSETNMKDAAQQATTAFATQTPPQFDSVEEQRAHSLERLAGACRIFGRAGFSEGLLGHLTLRDPENPDLFWANPVGISFNQIRVADLVQVDHEGNLVVGNRPVNPVGVALHSAIHRACPEVNAVCHAHSIYGSTWSAFGRPVDPITQDTAVFHGHQAIVRDPKLATSRVEADQFAAAVGHNKIAIHVGHGIFSTGASVDEAAWWFISMEKACRVQLLAAAAGEYEVWPDDAAAAIGAALGSPMFGWLSFQTLWDEIIKECPEFLIKS
ncbi:MAG: class II aldolase/adducin family protein [Halieaceae bacterium]|jgi:ribulose-5-phosphate 4-epimerase/fuculose-1-phosphate aldolase|nr:class II aldolase/adducin family protein [Halieaceae bacterium]